MAIDVGTFAGNFLQALTASRQRTQEQTEAKIERDAKLKLFELQLKREQQQGAMVDQQTAARGQLLQMLTGQSAAPTTAPNGVEGSQGPVAPVTGGPAKMPSLTELLADQKAAALFLQSGMGDLKDVATLQNQAQMRGILQNITGGGPAGASGPALPGGMSVQGIKFDTSGNPMFDIGPTQVKTWQVSPDGRTKIGYDDQGRPVANIPASPADRAPEDKPLTPEELTKFRTPNGAMLPPGTTLRQATALGAVPSASPGENDKSKALLVKNILDAEKTLGELPAGVDSGSVGNRVLGATPATAFATSEAYRKYLAAADRWTQNYVFMKSGATAGPAEMKKTFETFFPQPGDSDEVKAQKQQARLQESSIAAQTYNVQGATKGGAATAAAQLPEGVPAGSVLIGTAEGSPVYQAPDGKRYRVK